MSAIDWNDLVRVDYDFPGMRTRRYFSNLYQAKRFCVSKDRSGHNPKIIEKVAPAKKADDSLIAQQQS